MLIFLIVWYTQTPSFWYLVGAGIVLIGFIVAGLVDQQWKEKINRWRRFREINQQEINAINGVYSIFPDGSVYLDSHHPYTIDLDIFGHGSLFQYINRTATIFGENMLADWLKDPLNLQQEIKARQLAIHELAEKTDFRQQFREYFLGQPASGKDLEHLQNWLKSKPYFKTVWLWRLLAFLLPAITFASIVLSALSLCPYQIPFFLVMVQLFFAFAISRATMKEHQAVSRQVEALKKYGKALDLIQKTPFQSAQLSQCKMQLQAYGNLYPGEIIARLANLLNWMDSNLNMVASVLLNGLLMFNIHILMAVERWKAMNKKLIPVWFDGLAKFDAMNSLGNFACNNPSFIFPDVVSGDFRFEGCDIGHPLIPRNESVTNDLRIEGWHQLLIITGANMSGKSTSLRTIGMNILLGMVGAPVYASSFIFTPVQLFSCIRTNDSLMKRESYFYAELKRLKQIMDYLKEGHPTFLLLDEILRGTNSQDKQAGSMALIRQLVAFKVSGMIATHDLALGNLKKEEPDHIHNYCFEIEIANNKMNIDYKIRPGVCKNLNASFLMKEMGIITGKNG